MGTGINLVCPKILLELATIDKGSTQCYPYKNLQLVSTPGLAW